MHCSEELIKKINILCSLSSRRVHMCACHDERTSIINTIGHETTTKGDQAATSRPYDDRASSHAAPKIERVTYIDCGERVT